MLEVPKPGSRLELSQFFVQTLRLGLVEAAGLHHNQPHLFVFPHAYES